jgi:hypothetical protein
MLPTHGGLPRNGLGIQITGYTHEVQYPVEKEIVVAPNLNLHHLIARATTRSQGHTNFGIGIWRTTHKACDCTGVAQQR